MATSLYSDEYRHVFDNTEDICHRDLASSILDRARVGHRRFENMALTLVEEKKEFVTPKTDSYMCVILPCPMHA